MNPANEAIAGMDDPVLRNLWITQRYHELAMGLRDCGTGEDATWCAFAVWASKTAGSVIRNEDLPALVRQLLADEAKEGVERFNRSAARRGWLSGLFGFEHLARVIDRVCGDVAAHISAGNQLVFAELAGPFQAFVRACRSGGPAAAADAARAAVPPGPDGQELGRAFDVYASALAASGPERSWLVLAGNVLAVAHEQKRLQPDIEAALDAAIRDSLQHVLEDELIPHLPGPAGKFLDRLVDDLAGVLDRAWQAGLTATMLRLVTADETLDLCRDLPMLGGVMWPPGLAALEPGEAATVLAVWDRTRGDGRPTAVEDWAELPERMNYIVNLFRSRQRHAALFDPPFSDGQLEDLRAGRRPSGPL
ncbi:MAG TPA: hypothetical protein VFH58_09300 [Acidimicrobiales bacterium]|nr:hypothetical protein [Acidimicrobiales bacterium]